MQLFVVITVRSRRVSEYDADRCQNLECVRSAKPASGSDGRLPYGGKLGRLGVGRPPRAAPGSMVRIQPIRLAARGLEGAGEEPFRKKMRSGACIRHFQQGVPRTLGDGSRTDRNQTRGGGRCEVLRRAEGPACKDRGQVRTDLDFCWTPRAGKESAVCFAGPAGDACARSIA